MRSLVHKAVTLLLILVLLPGCRELYELNVSSDGDKVYFSVAENGDDVGQHKHFILYDISVVKQDCRDKDDCTMWELVRDQNKLEVNEENYLSLPITYGEPIINMQDKVMPKPITPGEYAVSATVAVASNQKIEFSRLVHGRFGVESVESGKIKLAK